MASKRTTARKRAGKGGKLTKAELIELLKKARAEVAKLLKDQRAGTLTQVDLEAGLEETDKHLELMEPFDDEI